MTKIQPLVPRGSSGFFYGLVFFANLLAEFSEEGVKRSIFVEPCFTCPTTDQRRSPDVDVGDQEIDQASIKKKTVAFMARNRVDSFAVELQCFVDYCVNQCDEVQTAYELLHRFNV